MKPLWVLQPWTGLDQAKKLQGHYELFSLSESIHVVYDQGKVRICWCKHVLSTKSNCWTGSEQMSQMCCSLTLRKLKSHQLKDLVTKGGLKNCSVGKCRGSSRFRVKLQCQHDGKMKLPSKVTTTVRFKMMHGATFHYCRLENRE